MMLKRIAEKMFAVGTVALMAMCVFAVVWILAGTFVGFNHRVAQLLMDFTVGTMLLAAVLIAPMLIVVFGMIWKESKKLWTGEQE